MKNAKSIAARLAGILIFALSTMALAEEAASVQPAGSVQVAQTENTARQTAPDSRPATLGDIHRVEDKIDRLEAQVDAQFAATNKRLDTIMTLIVGILLAIIAAMAGIITIMLPRREKLREPAPREPAQINPNTDKAPAR